MKKLILILFIISYANVSAVFQQINVGCFIQAGPCTAGEIFDLNSGDTFSSVENISLQLEGDFNGLNETIDITVNGQSSGPVNTGQQGGGFFPLDSSFINTALLSGESFIDVSGTSSTQVNNGFTQNGNTWNLIMSFDYELENSTGTGSSNVVVNINSEGINKEVFDLDTYMSIIELEAIGMVIAIFWKFWNRLLQSRAKRRRNFIY